MNLAQVDSQTEPTEYERLLGMAQRLYKPMSLLGIDVLVCDIAMPFVNGWWEFGWTHARLLLGLLLLDYQYACHAHLRRFCEHACCHSHKWYRVFNEVPVLMMVAALYLVVFKPFQFSINESGEAV